MNATTNLMEPNHRDWPLGAMLGLIGYKLAWLERHSDPQVREAGAVLREDVERAKEAARAPRHDGGAWLIECGKSENPSPHPLWWCGSPMRRPDCPQWTHDAHRAVRFARKEDAERMIHVVGMDDNAAPAFASEHVFIGGVA